MDVQLDIISRVTRLETSRMRRHLARWRWMVIRKSIQVVPVSSQKIIWNICQMLIDCLLVISGHEDVHRGVGNPREWDLADVSPHRQPPLLPAQGSFGNKIMFCLRLNKLLEGADFEYLKTVSESWSFLNVTFQTKTLQKNKLKKCFRRNSKVHKKKWHLSIALI